VHEDEFDAGGERGDHGGVASGGVKQLTLISFTF
jgi:hypothetical protein